MRRITTLGCFVRRGMGWVVLLAALSPVPADAHWCTNIWDTPSRLIVKAERDTVFISDTPGAQETLKVTVRNNFPYSVSGTTFRTTNSDFSLTVSPSNATIYAGENKTFTLTITRNGNSGDDKLYLQMRLANHFNSTNMDVFTNYWTKPTPTQTDLNGTHDQAYHLKLQRMAQLDSAAYLDDILEAFGHPRLLYTASGSTDGAWHPNSHTDEDYAGGSFDYWGYDHAKIQRGVISIAKLRYSDARIPEVFLNGMDDPMVTWRGMCAVLGAAFTPTDAVKARIETMASTDTCNPTPNCSNYAGRFSADDEAKAMAKAARYIITKQAADRTAAQTCMNSASLPWRRYICAAALGFAGEDGPVQDMLIADGGDVEDLDALFASYLLSAVADHRRGPSDTGCVSFFDEICEGDTTNPRAPQNVSANVL